MGVRQTDRVPVQATPSLQRHTPSPSAMIAFIAESIEDQISWGCAIARRPLRKEVLSLVDSQFIDLGVWMAIQNVVEKLHAGNMKHTEPLARTVKNVWKESELAKLTNVCDHWGMVLDLTVDDERRNWLIDFKQGMLYRVPPEETEVIKKVLESEDDDRGRGGRNGPGH